jgi:hypothetical protein
MPDKFIRRISHKMRDISQVVKCDCANMDGHLCYVCLEKECDEWAQNAGQWRDMFRQMTNDNDIPHDGRVVRVESAFRLLAQKKADRD